MVTKIIGTKKGEFGKDDFVYLITLTFIPLGSIVIGNIALKSYDLKGIMACVILFAINIIVFYLYDTMLKSQIAIRENVFLGQQQKYYQSQLETIKQNQDKINFLKHDIKKHNQQIRKYATMEKISVLLEYLSDVENLVEETETFIMTGNDDFDSLVNYKLALANALGAKVTVTTNLSENIFIKSIDLNIIIGNLLDNAIEALENAMDKLIYLRIECGSQIFSLACKNTYSKLPKEGQKTTKSDIVNHGFGLKSMKLAIRKYGGLIEISNDEKYFSTKILLYNME
ncbi:hypothetical protein FACS1894132_07300 [Clostridia bacterium]|nr:hypothetical protein FACS1894132_07300 [Clostridia bacterium]